MLTRTLASRLTLLEVTLAFTIFAFLFSLIGFLHPQPAAHYHEYSISVLTTEVIGHFSFGFLAALPLVDLELSFAVGSMAVLIDVDHLMAALGFSIGGRADHSAAFATAAVIIMILLARRIHLQTGRATKLALTGLVTVSSHLAYDIFSAAYVAPSTGSAFPLLVPFSFQNFSFPTWYWLLFEAAAAAISLLGYLSARERR